MPLRNTAGVTADTVSPKNVTPNPFPRTVSVVRRFGGEPQLMSNGNRCPMDLMSTSLRSVDIKSIGHQLRVHRQIVAQRFCPIKTV